MDKTTLRLENLCKKFGEVMAVDNVNLDITPGEFVTLLGPSGCGKTTTLRMVAGFESPTSGAILIDGVDMTHVPASRRNVGMVFQSYALFPNLTVAGNIGFGLQIARRPAGEIQERVHEMLALIKMENFSQRYPYQLSGGQQQRVALARALAIRPQVLLLDEPLSALDAKIRLSLRDEIRSIQRRLGITTIYVTHDQEEALSLSDRVVVMNEGRVEQIGTPFEIYNRPRTAFVASFIGTLNVLQAQVRSREGLLAIDGQLIRTAHPLEGTPLGAPLSIALRPERISLVGESTQANVLDCTVQAITFLGAIVRIQVRTGQNSFYLDTFNNPHLVLAEIGSRVKVTFSAESVWVLPDSAAVAPPGQAEAHASLGRRPATQAVVPQA
jgi:putative spermidine/putrescine transport system ATP-binding protein